MKPMTCKDAFSLMDEQGFVLNPDRPYTNQRFHELVVLCDRLHKVILEAESIFEELKTEMAEIVKEEQHDTIPPMGDDIYGNHEI